MGTVTSGLKCLELYSLDTFKDIWEQGSQESQADSLPGLDTFKDIWEPRRWSRSWPPASFRYLQGYMGTGYFRSHGYSEISLDTFKDIWEPYTFDLSEVVRRCLDTFKDIWEQYYAMNISIICKV